MMKKTILFLLLIVIAACKNEKKEEVTAQTIVDKSIEVTGGDLYQTKNISFEFRDKKYVLEQTDGKKVMKRIFMQDSSSITDVKAEKFSRLVNDSLVVVVDSMAKKYDNAINSVFYFALLPYGLNDAAVTKKYLGEVTIKGKDYYKVKVTFSEEGGGDDFDDTYLYWFNKETFKPDYLAYKFFVNDGGMRFRVAYNERVVNGIRFVDYENYKPKTESDKILEIDSMYLNNGLELLSKIELKNITLD
ncbi:deoxyribose-phosphate aldolase [Cellulophaga sp. 20_2_10]|uniref:DUF6503 family protein n=1 Tax=Cellulophaga sp. 20_2_10 TaxID=2942476 RepID=UPI00201B27B6|nr:DUF6503 family protein [Cellulophaga sp. 20_2_10]MCL5244768.1 deoxyribose-phosphate aldolase [Cellulophaga sp. 20_2_10]